MIRLGIFYESVLITLTSKNSKPYYTKFRVIIFLLYDQAFSSANPSSVRIPIDLVFMALSIWKLIWRASNYCTNNPALLMLVAQNPEAFSERTMIAWSSFGTQKNAFSTVCPSVLHRQCEKFRRVSWSANAVYVNSIATSRFWRKLVTIAFSFGRLICLAKEVGEWVIAALFSRRCRSFSRFNWPSLGHWIDCTLSSNTSSQETPLALN